VLNQYPFRNLIHKIKGKNEIPPELTDRMDDMPTHIAISNTQKFISGSDGRSHNPVTLTMIHNPSHLESQNAIGMGKTRAKIDDYGPKNWRKALYINAHGDAAFQSQGAAYEALTLCKLPNFQCNGGIHIITNNQLGFTTGQKDGRSSTYGSDIAKPFQIPIIHVNSNNPEAVLKMSKFMAKYWREFGKDILIDMVCYRKYGHNEVDEPAFTQPLMYKKIRSLKSPPQLYAEMLKEEGLIKDAQIKKIVDRIHQYFEDEYQAAADFKPTLESTKDKEYKGSRSMTHKWEGMDFSQFGVEPQQTGYSKEKLVEIAKASVDVPK